MSLARRVPVGVVTVITPWNVPLVLSMRSVAPALALGNAVVLKPDPQTPVCGGYLLARIFEEAGLPPGLLSVLPGGAESAKRSLPLHWFAWSRSPVRAPSDVAWANWPGAISRKCRSNWAATVP